MSPLGWIPPATASLVGAGAAPADAEAAQRSVNSVPWKELFILAPHLFWGCVILLLILFIGPRRVREMILSARKLGFAGFEIELGDDVAAAAAARHLTLPPHAQSRLASRLRRLQPLLECARLLWIDDKPQRNFHELTLLRRLCATVDIATTDGDARRSLATGVYDLVLSDMRRGRNRLAGSEFLAEIKRAILQPEVIFYVGEEQDRPPQAFGLTTRPDELFHLILDALERRRG
jgi:CheY-like chemotaxis protein